MPHPVPVRRTALLTALALACGPVAPITTYTAPAREYQGQAAGKPLFPCDELRATAARMRAGLPAQDDAIRKTQQQLDAARTGVRESAQEAQMLALKEATGAAVHQLDFVREAKSLLEKYPPSNMDRLAGALGKIHDAAENLEKLTNSGAAGVNIGAAIRQNQLTMSTFVRELQDSGISDELAKAAVASLAGPAGLLAVEIGITARDAIAAGWGLYNNVTEADAAQRNLDTMRESRSLIDGRLYEINDILTSPATGCSKPPAPPQDRIMTQPPAADPPPYTPVPPAKPAAAAVKTPPQHHGGGGQAVAGLLLGGAAAAALYGYAKNKYGPNNNCVAPTADIPDLCSVGHSSACSQALANQVAYCQCRGYSTFDATAGTCR